MNIFPLMLLFLNMTSNSPDRLERAVSAGVPVKIISVRLNDPRVHVEALMAAGGAGHDESFDSMLARSHPAIAINGAYFSKSSLRPIGDIVCHGELINRGMMGTIFAVTNDNQAIIRRAVWGHAVDWSSFNTVIGCGPALVLNGKIDVHPSEEGFHDPHIMGSTRRMGIALTSDSRLLIVTTLSSVTFSKWAEVMYRLGCTDAMNLDAGASLAMYYQGKTIIHPGRKLTNLLLVYVSSG